MNKFNQIFQKNECDKAVHNYGTLYELISTFKIPESIFEIGFMHGASMMSWSELFPDAELLACEIEKRHWKQPENNFNLILDDFRNVQLTHNYDWIIDDGSHTDKDVLEALQKFWNFVTPGGWYIIEDVHAGFWDNYNTDTHYYGKWIDHVNRFIKICTHNEGNESTPTQTGFVIQQKSIIAIQKPL